MKIGLVLGGGGARGIAHIGVLRALEEKNIHPEFIVGTSSGSIIAALLACGYSAKKIEAVCATMTTRKMLKRRFRSIRSLSDGQGLQRFVTDAVCGATFADVKIPLYVTCADYKTNELVMINEGPIARAVYCSCALPPLFAPVEHQGRMLVDGGAVAPVAAEFARTLGADQLIAVRVGVRLPVKKPKTFWGILSQFNIMRAMSSDRMSALAADIVICPEIPGANILDDSDRDGLIKLGYEAALDAIPETLSH